MDLLLNNQCHHQIQAPRCATEEDIQSSKKEVTAPCENRTRAFPIPTQELLVVPCSGDRPSPYSARVCETLNTERANHCTKGAGLMC